MKAPAKINLHLEVGPLRNDGFHELRSLFHMVDLHDEITLDVTACPDHEHGGFTLMPEFPFPLETNLMYRAYKAFREEMGARGVPMEDKHFSFHCRKSIPSGGGLGGGSSDGAAVLLMMNTAMDFPLRQDELSAMALGLGSDLPFFTGNDAAAIGEGRGELLRALEPLQDVHLLLLFPEWKVSTGDAYQLIDRKKMACWKDNGPAIEEMLRRPWELLRNGTFFNDFTPVVEEWYPHVKRLLAFLRGAGSFFQEMSGSGSTLFGLFDENGDANRAMTLLREEGFSCRKVKMLAKPYKPVYNG